MVSRIRREREHPVERSGVAKIRFHDLRHTVGTRFVRGAVDLRTVQEILGHASLKTTERYLHSNDKLTQVAVEMVSNYASTRSVISLITETSPFNASRSHCRAASR